MIFQLVNRYFVRASFPALLGVLLCMNTFGQGQPFVAADWKFESQRKEIAPISFVDQNLTYRGLQTLALKGNGNKYADGHWYKEVDVEPNQFFQFQAYFHTENIDEPRRSVVARLRWLNSSGEQVGFIEYPALQYKNRNEDWGVFRQSYRSPAHATKAKLELHYRWDANGSVHFAEVSLVKTDPPKSRVVKVATINYKPHDSKSPQENLEKFSQLVATAAAQHADMVCLPEGITLAGTELNYISASEPIPGASTQILGKIARKYNLYIIAGLLEKEGHVVYNTSVLIGRSGELVGKYRKLSLPREEIDGGVTPGDSLPVFDTDFGRVGMLICWDVSFPESARTLAQKGAEIIFLPIWGGNETLARARAIENQVYLVSSSYDMVSAVFDLEGNIIKQATKANPVAVANIDLSKQKLWPWLGDFKNRIPSEMPTQKAVQYSAQ